ncbi:MAG TPA: hypothetical protein VGN84_07185 [Solirubrobacterales bacterium]|nr:hypothetical protein [Solirubrobacterales bacterium]
MLAIFPASAGAASPETPGETFPASATPAGAYADGEGTGEYTPVSISDDGRYVGFETASTNLGEQGPAGAVEGFVKDLDSGELILVSRADGAAGEPAGEPGIAGFALSGDGRYVLFSSAATNLGTTLPGEETGEQHVYRRDLQSGETELVDRVSGAGGEILSRGATAAAISADGRYVLFGASVANLEDPDGDHAETAIATMYVRDTQTDTTTAVSRASGAAGELADKPSEAGSISDDGRYVTFASHAANLVAGVEDSASEHVYLRDLQSATTTLVSQNALGEPGDRGSYLPALAGGEGCEVEFGSLAFNLLLPSPLAIAGEQTYVANRCSDPATMTLVTEKEGELANFAYGSFGASGDGRKVVFAAEFPNPNGFHLYLRNLDTGAVSLLDRASGATGTPADGELQQAAISANGCRVAFASRATNLFGQAPPEGPSGEEPAEVYIRQLSPCDPSNGEPGGEEPGAGRTAERRSSPPAPAPLAELRIARLSRHKLVLSFSGPARAVVKIRRRLDEPHRHWKLVKTLAVEAGGAGRLAVDLPSLAPGRYRVSARLQDGKGRARVRLLTIPAPPARSG